MNGTKEVTDGNVRRDFPGGFPGDEHNAFTQQGRTKEENQMFNWISRLLHWRQGNELITKGKQTQFIPQDGVYVVARTLPGRAVLTIVNGTSHQRKMHTQRYQEVLQGAKQANNILTRRTIDLTKDITLAPRGTMVLEINAQQ